MYRAAEEHELLGDEEKAYVFYMRFFNLYTALKKTSDYLKDKVCIRFPNLYIVMVIYPYSNINSDEKVYMCIQLIVSCTQIPVLILYPLARQKLTQALN